MTPSLREATVIDPEKMAHAIFTLVVELVYSDGEPADTEWATMRESMGSLFKLADDEVMARLAAIAATPVADAVKNACAYAVVASCVCRQYDCQ